MNDDGIIDYNLHGSHAHKWIPQADGDSFCPICGGYKSTVEALLSLRQEFNDLRGSD